jgi:transposase
LDHEGEVLAEKAFRIPRGDRRCEDTLIQFLKGWSEHGRFAVEALGLNRWLVNRLQEEGLDVMVVDPVRLGLKALSKKTDRRDAREIARRLHLGDIDRHARTYYPDDHLYGIRKITRTRHKLISIRQQITNQIRGILNAYHLDPPTTSLHHKKSLAWLEVCPLPSKELRQAVVALARCLTAVQDQIRELHRHIEEIAVRADLDWLQKVPSVKALTAVTLHAELGEVNRFTSPRRGASYAGLVPRIAQSADHCHHGPITHRGSPHLRYILSQMAVRLLTRDPLVRMWSRPRLKRMHKNKVRTALARRLLIGILSSQRHGEPFSLQRCLGMSPPSKSPRSFTDGIAA